MATLKMELSPELEQQLWAEAARKGIDLGHYALGLLQKQLQSSQRDTTNLPPAEAYLLQQINLGLSAEEWELYHALIAKRQSETLTVVEQARLISITDQLEEANARRIAALIQLADLRGTSLEN